MNLQQLTDRIQDSWNAYSKGEMVDPVPFMKEIVTSTYLQAVEDIKEEYGWMNDGCSCCMEKDLETYLDEDLQSLKQTKDV